MTNLRRIVFFMALFSIALCSNQAFAFELQQNFAHSLSIGNSAKSFEHRIDLPENWSANGNFFVGRTLQLDGKLVVEREELTKTYYYVKVRLPKATLWFAKGSIDITLKAEKTDSSVGALDAPINLKVSGELYPYFSWSGVGEYSAISVMDRSNGKTLWERVILNDHASVMDEGSVRVGGKYTWAVKQSGEAARYSNEAQANFRVGTKQERCRQCFGQGYVRCRTCNGSGQIVTNGPNNTPVQKICYTCHGTGRDRCQFCNGMGHTTVPVIIPE